MDLKEIIKTSMTEAVLVARGLVQESTNPSDEDVTGYIEIQSALIATGGQYDYDGGVFDVTFSTWNALTDCCDILDNLSSVYGYEPMVFRKGESKERVVIDVEDIRDDSMFEFGLLIYMEDSQALYYEEDEDLDESLLSEVKRRIKVDSKGKKRIKMQCRPGFKWDGSACIKIAGAELATNRKAHRHASITKRSQGAAFQVRVTRKTKKANRFRKAMGLGRG